MAEARKRLGSPSDLWGLPMTRKCFNAVDATITDDDGWKLLIDTAMGDVLSISLSAPMLLALAREIESALPAPMSDPGVKAPAGPMRSSASKPRSPDDRSTRLRLVEALAPTIAEGLRSHPAGASISLDFYIDAIGSFVDRLQAIVERAPAKDAAP
jgi:hypothetical protein